MAFLDFLKKKEFLQIKLLEEQITSLQQENRNLEIQINSLKEENNVFKNQIDLQRQNNNILNTKVQALSKYQSIIDAEEESHRIIKKATDEASLIIKNAESTSKALIQKADKIVNDAIIKYEETKERALKEAQSVLGATRIEAEKLKEAATLSLNNAQYEAKELKQKANTILDEATKQASTIIKNAETRAEEIAGDAYKAKNEVNDLSKTIKALSNKIKGYGDDYLIPTYSLLDTLAEDFGYTEAGTELKNARERSRLMVKNDLSAQCDYVEDNRRTTAINFITDAFNGKVDTILAGVKQDNFGTLKQKIVDSYHLVNNLGKAFRNAVITKEYLDARVEELKWAVIATELRNNEKEEQRRIKEQIREEEKAKREYEKAIKDAEKEEDAIKKALEKAKKELEAASDEQRQKYEAQLAELNDRLKIAEERGQRAMSMAQQTKSGHVYIISNIGSFGENIYKIGMTRRLEPEDRVKELGDASVPFSFDIHAMIYSEDAPTLEKSLHRYFINSQVNKVNPRKEFFKVGISDVRQKIEDLNLSAKWTMAALAAEYRESLAIEQEMLNNSTKREEWERNQLSHLQNDLDPEISLD